MNKGHLRDFKWNFTEKYCHLRDQNSHSFYRHNSLFAKHEDTYHQYQIQHKETVYLRKTITSNKEHSHTSVISSSFDTGERITIGSSLVARPRNFSTSMNLLNTYKIEYKLSKQKVNINAFIVSKLQKLLKSYLFTNKLNQLWLSIQNLN